MKQLSKEQVEVIIPQLVEDNLIGHGSSRACYLVEFEGQQYAAKVGLDFGAVFQNEREKELYKNYEHLDIFTNIHYFYEDVLLLEDYMEEVFDTEDVESVLDQVEEADEDDKESPFSWFNTDIINQIKDVVLTLEDFQGATNDNYQLGSIGNKVYAYDYGYSSHEDCCRQVGCVEDYLYNMEYLMREIVIGNLESGLDTDAYTFYEEWD